MGNCRPLAPTVIPRSRTYHRSSGSGPDLPRPRQRPAGGHRFRLRGRALYGRFYAFAWALAAAPLARPLPRLFLLPSPRSLAGVVAPAFAPFFPLLLRHCHFFSEKWQRFAVWYGCGTRKRLKSRASREGSRQNPRSAFSGDALRGLLPYQTANLCHQSRETWLRAGYAGERGLFRVCYAH